MVFGILEDRELANVPGTGLLSAKHNDATIDDAGQLKRGTGKSSDIVLIPQPSDDPGDPLNWPQWKKEACFWSLILASVAESASDTLAAPGYVLLAKEFHVSVDEIASSFTASSLGFALFTLVQNALAFKYGLRPVYLLGTLLLFMSSVWTALSPSLTSVRASRVFQGFGICIPRALIGTTIEHIFFVHERGSRSIIWIISGGIGSTLGPFIYSYVVQNLSWQLGFWFVSTVCGLSFVGVFFFVPETTYHHQATAIHPTKNSKDANDGDGDTVEKVPPTTDTTVVDVQHLEHSAPCSKPPSFLRQLKIYNGTFSRDSLWKIFLRPYPFILSPITWLMFLTASVSAVWFNLVIICSTTIFTITYRFDAAQIGITHLSGLVGAILAIPTTILSDRAIIWISQRNHGIYEPEYRLVFMLTLLFCVLSYIGWGIGNDHHMPWMAAVVCVATATFSNTIAYGTAVMYLFDAHGANAQHILSLTNAARQMIIYGSTFFANGFILSHGVKVSLLILGACQAASLLLCIPMYVYGKRMRSFIARHPRLFPREPPKPEHLPPAGMSETGSKR